MTALIGPNAKIHTFRALRFKEESVVAEIKRAHASLVLSETAQKACCVDSTELLALMDTFEALRITAGENDCWRETNKSLHVCCPDKNTRSLRLVREQQAKMYFCETESAQTAHWQISNARRH